MHDSNDNDLVWIDLVQYAKWKSADKKPTNFAPHRTTQPGIVTNSFNCALNFIEKIPTQTGCLTLVIFGGSRQLGLCRAEEYYSGSHRSLLLAS